MDGTINANAAGKGLARSAGAVVQILAKEGQYAHLRLASGAADGVRRRPPGGRIEPARRLAPAPGGIRGR